METYPQRVNGILYQAPWWEDHDLDHVISVVNDYWYDKSECCQTWLVERAAERLFNRLGDRIDALRRVESEIPF